MVNSNLQKIVIIKFKFFNYTIGDILRAIKGSSLMGAWILSFCAVDYLAHIACITNNIDDIKNNYIEFIKKYMPEYDSDKIYAIRCALVHTYGLSRIMSAAQLAGYSFTHKNPERNRLYLNKIYHLNLSNFVFDLIKASIIFFVESESLPVDQLNNYAARSKDFLTVHGPLGEQYFTNFGNIDFILSSLDSKNINWAILENDIYKLCLSK